MVKRYVCQCLNVSLETLPTSKVSSHLKDHLFEQIESSYDATKREFLRSKFNELCLEINTQSHIDLMTINFPEFFNFNRKFPLLTGYSIQTTTSGDVRFRLNKCLICNLFTHLVAVTTTKNNIKNNNSSSSTNSNSLSADNISTNSLSHSSLSATEPSDSLKSSSFSYNVYLLVNTNQMKMVNNNNEMEEFKNSEFYSKTYDIILDSSYKDLNNETDANNLFGIDLLLNMESEIGKKVFLNRLEDTYKQQQSNTNESTNKNEEAFKLKLFDLVNSFLANNNNNNKKTTSAITTIASNVNQENKTRLKKPKETTRTRRVKQNDNENLLSSSVFAMEELEETNGNERFLYSDEDASNEEETTTTGIEDNNNLLEQLNKNVLKKRNSNVNEEDSDVNKSNKFLIYPKTKLNKDLVQSSKYSCSLPRDIPVMQGGRVSFTLKNIVNQSSEEENRTDNENHYYSNEKTDHQKRHKSRNNMTVNRHTQSMSASFKNPINYDDSESSPINNDIYEGDDELVFEDDNNNTVNNKCLDDDDDDAETNTKNMGQAISNLASSIVIKDGRELFGGVPSRRVPINSISKSCFE